MSKLSMTQRLVAGEEVKIVKGHEFKEKPTRVVFVEEYTHHLLFEAIFEHPGMKKPRTDRYKVSISKASLYCGHAEVRRKNGSKIEVKAGEANE